MFPAEAIGLLGGALTTLSFAPQVIKTYQTKSAKDFSWLMLIAYLFGIILWLAYGLMVNSISIIFANAATLLLVVPLIIMKFSFGRKA